ncbi:Bax inhibitor-1/YccA family protein [Salmonella enterica]|nr:Bax inhibitor-1/YccA family protein [Salmonella enterica]
MDRFPRSDSIVQARSGLQTYMAQVYGWMTVGLLLTAFIAWYAANTPAVMMFVFSSKITFFGLIIAQLALVFVLSGLVHKLSAGMATTLFMALIGIVLASLVNFWLKSEALMWAVTYIGVVVFVGLTAYDTQKLKNIGEQIDTRDSANLRKYSILGALTLYLDFINLFLMLLRIFGNRR